MSDRPTVNGKLGAYLQPLRYGLDSTGHYTEYEWHGTPDEIRSLIAIVEGSGAVWQVQESPTGAKTVLVARASTFQTEAPIDTWEFFAQELEKDILDADLTLVNGLTPREIEVIKAFIQNPDPVASPALSGNALLLYNLMLKGQRYVIQFAPIIRHTQTVSYNWTVKASVTNVGRLMRTTYLQANEAIPNTILFNLPTAFNSNKDGYKYAWLKKHPTVRVAANQRSQIEQEWQYGLWDTTVQLYGAIL